MVILARWSRTLGMVALALLVALSGVASATSVGLAAEERPDIVVIYVDDWSPNAPELWSDPKRTPALAEFVQNGLWLSGSTGSTPRCCPGRANVFTGQWSHNNGVTENDMGPYKPRDSFVIKLDNAGYHTLFAGKFMNRMPFYTRTEQSVLRYAKGWDEFDAIWGNHGAYYDYRLWTRSGAVKYRDAPKDHSTYVAATKLARHIRKAPKKQPLFAFASLFDGHGPNLPLPRFEGALACRDIEPFISPAWNEADVSDKPAYIQALPSLEGDGYELATRCEEAMSVDWALQKIKQSLKRAGRLKNTLFVFTADNGWLMGEHRVSDKKPPYSTPVPLYFLWPERWPGGPRTIDEPVSNVDLARTFCNVAGCRIGRSDGLDLLPLLDGEVDALERDFTYEESLHHKGTSPAWYGLRTTNRYDPDQRWVYTEYATGEHELYDLVADPYQLENRAGEPEYAEVEAGLAELLRTEVIEPNGVRFKK